MASQLLFAVASMRWSDGQRWSSNMMISIQTIQWQLISCVSFKLLQKSLLRLLLLLVLFFCLTLLLVDWPKVCEFLWHPQTSSNFQNDKAIMKENHQRFVNGSVGPKPSMSINMSSGLKSKVSLQSNHLSNLHLWANPNGAKAGSSKTSRFGSSGSNSSSSWCYRGDTFEKNWRRPWEIRVPP